MTTKVVKGSVWTLAGSVLPLAVSFISTPFIIRFLGSENYGVLLLVGLIPTYFTFADLGMGVASTKFASEAFGEGSATRENEFVWTAAAIAGISSLLVAIPLCLFSYYIVRALNVPEHLLAEASIALKIASAAFVLSILATVLNSPMLARLRMDLNALTQAIPRVLLAALTPVVLFYGWGIIGAVSLSFAIGVGTLTSVILLSAHLLPQLSRPAFRSDHVRLLLTFGGAWFIAMIATMLLANLEKFVLTKMVSVQALAYYSVAFSFASMATFFSWGMVQSLIPAFSQLYGQKKMDEFDGLLSRAIRINMIGMLPTLTILFVIAKPFLMLWAGEEFGRESSGPFYVLLIGLLFNSLAYVPYAALLAAGRSDLLAKVYWIELVPYILIVAVLIYYFGILGAAMAWSLRVLIDAVLFVWLTRRVIGAKFGLRRSAPSLGIAFGVLMVPVIYSVLREPSMIWLFVITLVCTAFYAVIIWNTYVLAEEKSWLLANIKSRLFWVS